MVAPSLVGTFKLALAPPTHEPLTAASRTLLLQGAVFALVGLTIMLLPGRCSIAQRFDEKELAMFRYFGVVLLVVGWEYIEGARSNSRHFVAATIFLEVALLGPFFLALQWRCLQIQGVIYAVVAGVAVFFPGIFNATIVQLFGEAPIEGAELAMFRMVGALLFSIAYTFVQSAKENTYYFPASTIFGRLVIVPAAVILVLVVFSTRRSFGIAVAALDVFLALVTYSVWSWQASGHKHSVLNPCPSDGHP